MMFDWCARGNHKDCKRKFQRFIVDPKTNKITYLDEWVECDCKKRGCACYVKPADRKKAVKRKRKS